MADGGKRKRKAITLNRKLEIIKYAEKNLGKKKPSTQGEDQKPGFSERCQGRRILKETFQRNKFRRCGCCPNHLVLAVIWTGRSQNQWRSFVAESRNICKRVQA